VQAEGTTKAVNGGVVGSSPAKCRTEQLATRIIAERTGIPRARSPRASPRAISKEIRDYSIELQSLPFYVDETGGLSISQLTARARRLKRQKGLDLLSSTTSSCCKSSGKRANENRVQEVTEITTSLKGWPRTQCSRNRVVAVVATGRKPR